MGSLACLIMAGIILSDVTGQDLSLSSKKLEDAEMAAQEESNSEEATDDGVVDADFEVVDED